MSELNNFEEDVFIHCLVHRPEDARTMAKKFDPAWLANSKYVPIINEVFEYVKKFGEPPSFKGLHKLFKDKDPEVYESRYKKIIDEVIDRDPDSSEMIITMQQVRDVSIIRSFNDFTRDQSFLRTQAELEGQSILALVDEWLSSWNEDSEEQIVTIQQAVNDLIASHGFIPDVIRIPSGIQVIDDWTGGGLRTKQFGIVMAPSGSGKCLGLSTRVIKDNGIPVPVGNIEVGDRLMGPDSEPRRVLSITRGRGPMYRVTPLRGGIPFECNADHVLSLRCTNYTPMKPNGLPRKESFDPDELINIELKDYLKLSKYKRSLLKLWRTHIDLPYSRVWTDPYFIGVYLGDGTKVTPEVTLGHKKQAIVDYLHEWAKREGKMIKKKDIHYRISDPEHDINRIIKSLVTDKGERHIPDKYLYNDAWVRLDLLAGLLDTDGHLGGNGYEIACKDEHFKDQLVYLGRSLGFMVSWSPKVINDITYYRVNINGDVNHIPCKVVYKKALPREQIKNHLRTGFSIEPIGEGDYIGFQLDGDQMFLLEDFTVTHNSTILSQMAHKMAGVEGRNVLFLSNEMTLGEITERLGARISPFSADAIQNDPTVLNSSNLTRLWKAWGNKLRLGAINREISCDDLDGMIRKLKNIHGWKPDVIILDYMERMKPNEYQRRDAEWTWLGNIAKDLFRMAKKDNYLIWTACQTNREGMRAANLSMSMGQGSIRHFQEASCIIGLKQVPLPGSDDFVGIQLEPLKVRSSKRPFKAITLKANLNKMNITNDILVEQDTGKDNT